MDTSGDFSSRDDIITGLDGANSAYGVDVDADGYPDVVATALFDGRVVLSGNDLDGGGVFEPTVDLKTSYVGANGVAAADLDGDGDVDVLSSAGGDDVIWYVNDGSGSFSARTIIDPPAPASGTRALLTADVDGDGDIDVVVSISGQGAVWYPNDGTGDFSAGSRTITVDFASDSIESIYAVDLDGDGDIDVLTASFFGDRIVWHENTDGAGTFSDGTTIPLEEVEAIYATDLDGDGDADMLAISRTSTGRLVWYENLTVQ